MALAAAEELAEGDAGVGARTGGGAGAGIGGGGGQGASAMGLKVLSCVFNAFLRFLPWLFSYFVYRLVQEKIAIWSKRKRVTYLARFVLMRA